MLIELQDISFGYAGTNHKRLKHVSLSVNAGECILLTGENGCGKTTLTRILNGLCPQFYDGEISGRYLHDGQNALEMDLDAIGIHIGNVFQDPRIQFFASNSLYLKMKNIVCRRGKMTILDHITLNAEKGQITAITGRNGAGKATLCKIAAGLLKETAAM